MDPTGAIDLFTFIIATSATLFLLGLVFLLYGASGTFRWAPTAWGLGLMAFAAGTFLNAWEGHLSDFVILVVSNLLMQGAMVLLWSGTSSFMRIRRPTWLFIAHLAVALFTAVVFVYLYPSQQIRIVLFSGLVAIASCDSGRMLVIDRYTPNLILGGVLMAVGLLYSLRLLGGLTASLFPEWVTTQVLVNWYGVFTLAVCIFWAGGMLAVTAVRYERDLHSTVEQLRVMALTDQLTQLGNRRYMQQRLEEAQTRFLLTGKSFSLLFVDVDDFKLINDTYGHECGDLVLQNIAHVLRENFHRNDDLARWGGEEFMILLLDTDAQCARQVAERLLETVSALPIRYGEASFRMTITIGGATSRSDRSVTELIKCADRALYQGKWNGRNRVEWEGIPLGWYTGPRSGQAGL